MERTMVEGTSAQMLGATDISRYPAKNSTNDAAHARNRCGFLHPDMGSARLCTAPSCAQQQQHLKVHPRSRDRLSWSLLEAGWQRLTLPDAHGPSDLLTAMQSATSCVGNNTSDMPSLLRKAKSNDAR